MASQKEPPTQAPTFREEENIHVELTSEPLNVTQVMNRVKSSKAGAVVLFAGMLCQHSHYESYVLTFQGTTRDSFDGRPVKALQYSAYAPLALRTMLSIAQSVKAKHQLSAISMVHRLGVVPIGEESILIAVSSPHRQAAWRAGEEALEECKAKVEVWKLEEFGGEEGGVWRANRDGIAGVPVNTES
ncbi:Molybdopterin synthase catalytic subunit [Trapelia coarctata]|nr:Molybdopterin synthase catalytic subunit [Trapelia coarctata]